ncbi:MAG: hypothetical protein JO227_06445 [Acetobacteraceae bacterium]|nr:hypothetical protein [Acetobacteraceae bacterium]
MLDAIYLPPARQADVFRAVRKYGPSIVGLIDGVFLDSPAVWHREILWAMSQGVHVFGAASMGALRAAELAPFGMQGVGRIAAAYRTGIWPGFIEPFEDDDEVAVIHAPAEAGFLPLSDAMVDLRETLLAAESAGVIPREQRDRLSGEMKRLHFPERSFARLKQAAHSAAVAEWIETHRIARKRLDAQEMLSAVAQFAATNPVPFRPSFRFERALVWEQFVAGADAPTAEEYAALEELRLDPRAWRACERAVLGRLQAPAESVALDREFERFRVRGGLWRRADLDGWMQANALDAAGLERLLRQEAALDKAGERQDAALAMAMADHLRLEGQFAALLERTRSKLKLTHVPPLPSGPHLQAVLDWYLAGLNYSPPATVATVLSEGRWAGEAELARAVWREYLFQRASR